MIHVHLTDFKMAMVSMSRRRSSFLCSETTSSSASSQAVLRMNLVLLILVAFLQIHGLNGAIHANSSIKSAFGSITRHKLLQCEDLNPFLKMTLDTTGPLADVQTVVVTVSGIIDPSDRDWIGVFSAASHKISQEKSCCQFLRCRSSVSWSQLLENDTIPAAGLYVMHAAHLLKARSLSRCFWTLCVQRSVNSLHPFPAFPSVILCNYSDCLVNKALYVETGDLSDLPLLCDYPVKFKFVKDDPAYLSCKKSNCSGIRCAVKTCSGSVSFRLVNIRTDITFVFFTGGLTVPCILKISRPLPFARPLAPLYGHLSVPDSSATSMKLTWVSGDNATQYVEYAGGRRASSSVTTFTQDDMCDGIKGPAKDFGWHNPGFIHSATMTGLSPATSSSYRYGSDKVGWSKTKNFTTPPAGGSKKLNFIVYGDMGKAERDSSLEHYIQPGSLQVIDAIAQQQVADVVFHIGDISYATGFLAEWDSFLEMIEPVASRAAYMTAIGNHERDFPRSGSKYETPDSGGECGVPYEKYFPMPSQALDKPWYSIELGPVHFTVMSTEHDWTENSEQYNWIKKDLASVDRSRTPWLIFTGHRPMYSTQDKNNIVSQILPGVDRTFAPAVEPLLQRNKVDLAFWGHVHNYERTCAVYNGTCTQRPTKDSAGIDTYNASVYSSPIHAVVGMAGFSLDAFPDNASAWSLVRISEFGYVRVTADKKQLLFEYVSTQNRTSTDQFKIIRS